MPIDPEEFKRFKERMAKASGKMPGQPTLGEQIAARKKAEMAQRDISQQDPNNQSMMQPVVDAGQGFMEGLKRQDALPGSSMSEQVGQTAGRLAPMIAGGVAANTLLPGSGLVTGALSDFAGNAGGELAGMGLSKAMGGNAPGTMKEAGLDAGLAGAGAATVGAGLNIVQKLTSVAPELAQAYLKVPVESLKRLWNNPAAIPTEGTAAKLALDTKAINSLKGVQDGLQTMRKVIGKEVESALESFQAKTKGVKVFDVEPLAKDIRQFLLENSVGDKTVDALTKNDLKKVVDVVKSMEKSPMKDAKGMVQIRRELDKLSTFNTQGVPVIQSDIGQRALDRMGHLYRETIDGAAQMLGHKELIDANQKFHQFALDYDDAAKILHTKAQDAMTLHKQVGKIEGMFNEGGLPTQTLEDIGNKFPALKKQMDNLLDAVAGRSFTRHALGTPSGNAKDLVRAIAAAEGNAGKAFKSAAEGSAASSSMKPAINAAKDAGKALGKGKLVEAAKSGVNAGKYALMRGGAVTLPPTLKAAGGLAGEQLAPIAEMIAGRKKEK